MLDQVKFDTNGLVPVVAQDAENGEVLMVAYMNREALAKTLETRVATYWSRSRQKYWVKGETSGHVQHVREALLDCDGDTVVIKVEQTGVACHEGYRTCFFRRFDSEGNLETLGEPDIPKEQIYG